MTGERKLPRYRCNEVSVADYRAKARFADLSRLRCVVAFLSHRRCTVGGCGRSQFSRRLAAIRHPDHVVRAALYSRNLSGNLLSFDQWGHVDHRRRSSLLSDGALFSKTGTDMSDHADVSFWRRTPAAKLVAEA